MVNVVPVHDQPIAGAGQPAQAMSLGRITGKHTQAK
jgi:hypothetical protein